MNLLVLLVMAWCFVLAVVILRSASRRQALQGGGRVCPHCGADNRPPARYCGQCGGRLA